jgi:hypothetical protein
MASHPSQLRSRSARGSRRGWNSEEDKALFDAIGGNARPDWRAIATSVPAKTARQCRERFTSYLNPATQSAVLWTTDDDKLLLNVFTEFGPVWPRIAAYFPTRSQTSIKNRLQTLTCRRSPPRPPQDLGCGDLDLIAQCFAPKRKVRWIVPDGLELQEVMDEVPF